MTNITFVLPCTGNSGGVRVTVEMATRLSRRGFDVRIAHRTLPLFSKDRLMDGVRLILRYLQGSQRSDWMNGFKGHKERYRELSYLKFSEDEIVIAVGEHTVKNVYALSGKVIKVRYCHGFVDRLEELNRTAWGVPMPTLSVTPALIPRLNAYSGEKVLAVVPNGINTSDYYLENHVRDGIGLIFRDIPQKGPDIAKALVRCGQTQFPHVPWHMFGTSRRPKEFARHQYRQFPSVAKARELYNRCKIWLVTSSDEGFCLPMLEAMACGCVVISSDHLVAADIIEDGVNGFIVPYGNVEAYLEKIMFLLDRESERQKMVTRGLETARRFTWEKAVSKMEQALEQLQDRIVLSESLAVS